jgi:hypothetical protein
MEVVRDPAGVARPATFGTVVKVVLTSGYSDMPLAASEAVLAIRVIGKPYTREKLACALRAVLDG